jgi:glucosamine--fructose-6-phosphate aminotransferase (isomerizing)
MVNRLYQDSVQQPQALRDLIAFYAAGAGAERLASLPARAAPLLTGMGASFHAAQAIVPYFSSLHIPALAVEATELLYYGRALLHERSALIFVSQSGASAEVAAILEELPAGHTLLAVTNNPHSPLARHAQVILPILAGVEQGVATKTYINSLAMLWLLARRWGDAWSGGELQTLLRLADACEQLLSDADRIAARWMEALGDAQQIVFVGHGPHAATARQAAMLLAERARLAAIGTSAGAFRHGPIEIVQPGVGVVIFAAPGRASDSAQALAAQLHSHGARVLLVENGHTRGVGEPGAPAAAVDEFLSPILDVIPAQLFADALARQRGIAPEFRYISKVVTQL